MLQIDNEKPQTPYLFFQAVQPGTKIRRNEMSELHSDHGD